MEQKQWPAIIVTAVITAIVVGSGVYLWQNRQSFRTPPSIQPETIVSQANYINSKWNFSLEIPEGYYVSEDNNFLTIVKKATEDDETPLPEMNIRIEQSNITAIKPTQSMNVISEEAVIINGVQGIKSTVSFAFYPAGNACPIYRLIQNGVVYEFSLYECLDSDIFEKVTESFKIPQ